MTERGRVLVLLPRHCKADDSSEFVVGQPLLGLLQHFRCEIRKARAFAAPQRDVCAVRPMLESIHGVGQTGGRFGQVGGVDLLHISQADHLGPRTGTGQ